MRITYNQIEILEIIYSFRYLPLKVLVKIARRNKLYAFRQNISRIINRLVKENYLKSFYYGNNWKVLYLSRKGADILASVKGVEAKEIGLPNEGMKVQFAMLEHTVKISELYEQFLDNLTKYPEFKLIEWLGDQKALYHYSFKSSRSGKLIKHILSPDSYFIIQKEDSKSEFFIEYDTGNMDKEQLSRKFMRYFEYFTYGNWETKFDHFPSILFITDRSEEQVQNLIGNDDFTLEKAIENRTLFAKSNNVLLKGLGVSENIKSLSADKIRGFLQTELIFMKTNSQWSKQLFEKLLSF